MNGASFVFPAVKGIQARHEFFIAMVPLEVIVKFFPFADEELPPEARAQRVLNRNRIPEISEYILNNPESYVFSALTASVDGEMVFQPVSDVMNQVGTLSIAMTSRFLINDGQHRRAAIEEAIKVNPSLKKEHISVVFYQDEGLQRSQQMFADLNRYAAKPTKSLTILYNTREEAAVIAKKVISEVSVFDGLIDKENTSISQRSKALFTLSAISTATSELLANVDLPTEEKEVLAIRYWHAVSLHMPEWSDVKYGRRKASDIRKDYICSLSITLVALGYAGNALIKAYPEEWEDYLKKLDAVDWRKGNPAWEDLVFVNGKVAANRSTQRAMSVYMKNLLLETAGI